MTRIGIIADTHGLLRPEAIQFLDGVDEILHAGDFGDASCYLRLGKIAPLTGVLGNVDYGAWADELPMRAKHTIAGLTFCLAHREQDLCMPDAPRPLCAIFGHSHNPCLFMQDDVVYCNPGSPGPRRFTLPISIADCIIENHTARFTTYSLDPQTNNWTPTATLETSLP